MRKLLEIAIVFTLGWLLAVMFVTKQDQSSQPSRQENSITVGDANTATPPPADSLRSSSTDNYPVKTDFIAQQLEKGEISSFLEALKQLRSTDQQQQLRYYQTLFIKSLKSFKQSKQYAKAISWLNTYLQSEYDDVNALQTLADFHYLQNNYLAAIDTLYLAKSYSYDSDKLRQLSNAIRKLTSEYTTKLEKQDNQLALLDLYQRLVNVEPEHSQHHLRLAQIYIALGNYYDAKQALNVIAYSPEAEIKVQQLLRSIESQSGSPASNGISVDLLRQGNHLSADTLFNHNTSGRLLLDTGASLTVLTPRFLQKLQMDHLAPQRMAWFNTANGVVEAPIYVVDDISVGGQSIKQLEIAVMDLNNPNIDGLLGMNYLKHFRFSIDQENNAILLSPRN